MKKNRTTLKERFKKGAIPTEADFADLIDSMLNQAEDNISKLPNDALRVTATGVDEAVVNFYRVENNEEKLAWQFKQKPDGKTGLSISDTVAPRLFIENGTGFVGVGTTTPKAKLQVLGGAIMPDFGNGDNAGILFPLDPGSGTGDKAWIRYYPRTAGSENMTLELGISNETDDHIALMPSGAVGVGTKTPGANMKLRVEGGAISTNANLHTERGRLAFSNTPLDPNHSIYNNGTNIDAEGAWDGMKMNVFNGLDVRVGDAGARTQKSALRVEATGNLGLGVVPHANARLDVQGVANIHDGNPVAVRSGYMSSGSLTIGSTTKDFGGGTNWNASTAGLLLETRANTEIAVHDSNNRVASLMFYEGDAANRITIGRDMAWGGISNLVLNGNVGVNAALGIGTGTAVPVAKLDIAQEARSGTHPAVVKGLYVTAGFSPDSDGVEFRHSNGSQGLGFGYNTIYAAGSIANQDIGLKPRGSGKVSVAGPMQVNGQFQVSGAIAVIDGGKKLQFTDSDISNNLKLQLWSSYGFGINSSTLFYAADGNHSFRDANGTNERMLLTTAPNGGLTVRGTGASSFAGNLGIGVAIPRTRLDTGNGVLSGAANDYMKAQFTLSGGGTVTWGGQGGRLKWSNRFIAISAERSATFANGHLNISQPTTDIPAGQVYDGVARSANANGVVLNGWEAIYAVHNVGADENSVSFQIVRYTNNFYAPSNWVLVAVVNADDNTVKLGTGLTMSANMSSSYGSSIPVGVITMWSGAANNVPGGWALCDGGNGTPNLRDRFIVGAGSSYGVGATGGEAMVTLSVAQMPSHNHTNGIFDRLMTQRSDGANTTDGADRTVGEPDILTSATIQPAGGNQAHENRPPFYALAYIMKL